MKEHFGPVLAFGAAGAGIDLHDGRQFVFGLVEGALELYFFYPGHRLVIGLTGLFFGRLAALPEIEQHDEVFHGRVHRLV